MPHPLLSVRTLDRLRPLLQYVSVTQSVGNELADFCRRHQVPTKIHIKKLGGAIVATPSTDRKKILLNRVLRYLETGTMPDPTTFPPHVVSSEPLPNPLRADHAVYYGQYKNGNGLIDALVKSLTGGRSTFCAVGQEVIRGFWSQGVAPSYQAYAEAFLEASAKHQTSDNPEWAYLNDKQQAERAGLPFDSKHWKHVIRPKKAAEALAILNAVPVPRKEGELRITDFFSSKRSSGTMEDVPRKKGRPG